MVSFQTVVRFIVNYIPYGKEIESSVKGPYFYNEQVYRDEEDSRETDIEKGNTDCTYNEPDENCITKNNEYKFTSLQVV
jgi:hypothetical protein